MLLEVPVGMIQADKRKKDSASGGRNGTNTTKAQESVASTSQTVLWLDDSTGMMGCLLLKAI